MIIILSEKRWLTIRYVIKSKKLYIRLSENGKAVTCSENDKGLFEYSKAKNIVDSLPKNLKKFKFKVEAVPDIPENTITNEKPDKREEYIPSENITRWIDKFGTCEDILNEAKEREKQIIKELNNTEKELLDFLHIIEIEKPKDLYGGWLIYKKIRDNRKKRREFKDELIIVENVLREINPSCLQRKNVKKAINGLVGRKYRFRIIEEKQSDDMQNVQ